MAPHLIPSPQRRAIRERLRGNLLLVRGLVLPRVRHERLEGPQVHPLAEDPVLGCLGGREALPRVEEVERAALEAPQAGQVEEHRQDAAALRHARLHDVPLEAGLALQVVQGVKDALQLAVALHGAQHRDDLQATGSCRRGMTRGIEGHVPFPFGRRGKRIPEGRIVVGRHRRLQQHLGIATVAESRRLRDEGEHEEGTAGRAAHGSQEIGR
mmetsp:Transcript_23965/g.65319  ORF Transcript_23965/g.65319 Transcript_23965/m.65319 type:complete len:212 (-) Transcript_23965:50-685(-)